MAEARPVWRRRARRVAVGLGVGLGAVVLALAGTYVWLRTPPGQRFLARQVEVGLTGLLAEGSLEVGALRTDLLTRLAIEEVALRDADGRALIAVRSASVRLRPLPLLRRRVVVPALAVDGLRVDLRTVDGQLDLLRLLPAGDPDAPPAERWLPVDLDLARVALTDARVVVDGAGVEALSLSARALGADDRVDLLDLSVDATWVGPGDGPLSATGALSYDGEAVGLSELRLATMGSEATARGAIVGLSDVLAFELDVAAGRLDLERIDPLIGHAGLRGAWGGELRLTGPLADLHVDGALDGVEAARGGLDLGVALDLAGEELSWRAAGTLRELHLDDLLAPVTKVLALTGTVEVEGRGTSWPDGLEIVGRFDGGHQEAYGYSLDALGASFRIAEGVVHLTGLSARNPLADLVGEGTIDVVDGPLDLRLSGPCDAARLADLGAGGMSGAGRLDLRLRGDLFAEQTAWRFGGRVQVADFAFGTAARVALLEAGVDGLVGEEEVTVALDVDALGVDSGGARIARARDRAVTVIYAYSGYTTVDGASLWAEELQIPGGVSVARADGTWAVAVPPSGEYAVEASLVVGAHEVVGFPGTGGVVEIAVDPDAVQFDVYLNDGPRPLVQAMGSYALEEAVVTLAGLELAPVPGGTWRSLGPGTLRVVEGGVAEVDLRLRSPHGRVGLRGDLGTAGAVDAEIELGGLDLAYLPRLAPSLAGLGGKLSGTARLAGPADAVALDAQVAGRVAWGEEIDVQVALDARGDGRALELALATADDTGPLASLAGSAPLRLDLSAPALDPDGPVDLALTLAPGPIARLAALAGAEAPAGELSATAVARGPLRDPELRLDAVAELPVPGWTEPARVEASARRVGDRLSWWIDGLDGHVAAARFDGTAATALGDAIAWAVGARAEAPDWSDGDRFARELDAHLALLDLSVERVASAAGLAGVARGSVAGALTLSGSATRPRLEGGLGWSDAALGAVELLGANLTVLPTDEGYALAMDATFDNGGRLDVSGPVPIAVDLRQDLAAWSTGALDLRVEGRDLPLGAVAAFVPGATEAAGVLDLSGTVGGTVADPDPVLSAGLREGALGYAPTGVRYEQLTAALSLSRDALELSELRGRTRPLRRQLDLTDEVFADRFTGALRVELEDWSPAAVRGAIELDQAWLLALPDRQVRGSGGVSASGTYPELALTGAVRVDSAVIVQDLASFLTVGPLALDPRITTHRGAAPSRAVVAGPEEPGLWESMTVDVDVDLARNLEVQVAFPFIDDLGALGASVTRADVAARLGGALTYALRGGEQSLQGPVDVLGGTVRVLQTQFALSEGSATFQGDLYDPILDLSAYSEVGGARVDLDVSGTANAPTLDFTSEQYPDQTQILTLLITGRAPDQLSADQGSAATQALLGLVLSSVLSGARFGSLSFDPDGTLRIGIPVSRDAYLETALATQPSLDENQFVGELEWQLAPKLVLDVAIGNRTSWVDLFWEARY